MYVYMHWYSKSSQNSSYKRQPSISFGKPLDSGMDPWHFNLANSVFIAVGQAYLPTQKVA